MDHVDSSGTGRWTDRFGFVGGSRLGDLATVGPTALIVFVLGGLGCAAAQARLDRGAATAPAAPGGLPCASSPAGASPEMAMSSPEGVTLDFIVVNNFRVELEGAGATRYTVVVLAYTPKHPPWVFDYNRDNVRAELADGSSVKATHFAAGRGWKVGRAREILQVTGGEALWTCLDGKRVALDVAYAFPLDKTPITASIPDSDYRRVGWFLFPIAGVPAITRFTLGNAELKMSGSH